MPIALLAVLLAAAPAAEPAWQTYADPTGTVTLELPATWVARPPDDVGFAQIVSFELPRKEAAFTLSVTPDLELPEELPLSLLKLYFPPGAELSEPRRDKGPGWNGVRQEASAGDGADGRTWLGAFWAVGSTMVAITLSDASTAIERATFERIASSVRFRSAPPRDETST